MPKIILAIISISVVAGFIQYWINHRLGIYFGFPRHSRQKSHHLTKLAIPSLKTIIKYPPEVAKDKLQKDFIEKVIPEGIALLKPGHSMYLITHLVNENDFVLLPFHPQWEVFKPNVFVIGSAQFTAWLTWLIRSIRIRNFSKPPRIIGRTWYKITWTKPLKKAPM